jgi:hypothetical protein
MKPEYTVDDWRRMLIHSQLDFAFVFIASSRAAFREGRLEDSQFSKQRAEQILEEIRSQTGLLSELDREELESRIVNLQSAIAVLNSMRANA